MTEGTDISWNELEDESHRVAVKKGWYESPRTFGDFMALFHSEIAEAFEEYRNKRPYNEIYYDEDGKPEGIPIEIADLLIRVADFCKAHGIDVVRAIQIKMYYNEFKRPWRHGGKAV